MPIFEYFPEDFFHYFLTPVVALLQLEKRGLGFSGSSGICVVEG
jgi:hypothetical protein